MTDEREQRDHCGNCRFFLKGQDQCCANPPSLVPYPDLTPEDIARLGLDATAEVRPTTYASSPACRFHTLR